MYDMAIERVFHQLSNGIRHVMPSTDRRLELKEKTSMAQTVSQLAVYADGTVSHTISRSISNLNIDTIYTYYIPFDRSFL
jgi:hypothetical protein